MLLLSWVQPVSSVMEEYEYLTDKKACYSYQGPSDSDRDLAAYQQMGDAYSVYNLVDDVVTETVTSQEEVW